MRLTITDGYSSVVNIVGTWTRLQTDVRVREVYVVQLPGGEIEVRLTVPRKKGQRVRRLELQRRRG